MGAEILTDEQLADMRTRLSSCSASGRPFTVKWREVKLILATILTLQEQLKQAKAWQMDVEEREAAVWPEDVPFDEYIRHLQKHNADLEHDLNEAIRQCNEDHAHE